MEGGGQSCSFAGVGFSEAGLLFQLPDFNSTSSKAMNLVLISYSMVKVDY